jgi:hypothetical protein
MTSHHGLLPVERPNQPPIERRVHPRYAISQQCCIREKWAPWSLVWTAAVRDVSRTGVGIVFRSWLKPGTPLEIELPNLPLPLLYAYVIHATTRPEGHWLIGCRLYRNFDEGELRMLLRTWGEVPDSSGLLREPDERVPTERRAWVRCCCTGECHVRGADRLPDVFEAARVRDISPHGIGLVLTSRVARGSMLDLEFPGAEFNRVLLAQVVHVTRQPDGTWLVGCQFAFPLDVSELHFLLQG